MESCVPPRYGGTEAPGGEGQPRYLVGFTSFVLLTPSVGRPQSQKKSGMAGAAASLWRPVLCRASSPLPAALGRCSRLCLRVFATTVSRVEGGFLLPCVLAGELKIPTGLVPCKCGSCPCPARVTGSGQLSPFCTAVVASGRPGCVQAGTLHRVPFAPVPECYRLTNKDSHAALCHLLYHGSHHLVTESEKRRGVAPAAGSLEP